MGADAVESPEAVRSVKSNEQEESHEDHESRGSYTPDGRKQPVAPPRLDIAG